MNRETSIHSSDTFVVVDRSRGRRRMVILGAIASLALLVIAIAVLTGRGSTGAGGAPGAATGSSAGQIPSVTVVVPGRTQVGRVVTASGPLGAKRDQPIGIAGQGGRVIRVLVDAGSWVNAGQVLAVVDRSVQAQQAAQQAAQVEAARAQAALAQSDYDRAIALQGRGFVSKAEIDSKKAARDAAYAQVKVTQAQLGATRAQINQLNVVAPAPGLILARSVEVGQIVSPGSGALFRLAEGGLMEMRAQLAQQDLAYVHVGMPAQVTPVGSTQATTGSVWQVAPVIDPQSRLGEVRIAVPYTQAMRPGGYAEAKITAGTTTAPVLPQSAVQSDDKGNYVYVVNGRNQVERRNITIGTVSESGVTIASGLSGNEAVVLSAGPFLNPGQKINPKREAAAR
ncbi:MAG TPA: efflux RND transporter periplasmic adaptor subunit [Sphingomicrobium sp.]|jgi:RND family efflux transporter MFP subunit|nr:efflux RND transporter periplasmic adaptor subunit [Sphingomicrobium sp.]